MSTQTLLTVKNVTKRFGGLVALNDVSFEIKEKEIVGIIGPNGAGKTTLFNVITGFYHPDAGRIIFNGVDITKFRPDQICSLGLTRTFQLVKPFKDLTVFENILIGALLKRSKAAAVEKAEKVLKDLDLEKMRNVPVKNIPIAERKIVEAARALATEPKMLLLDEVAAGLNPTETVKILETLKKVREQGVTLCLVEHVMRFIMGISERILVLDRGVKIAEGPPSEIAANESVIQAYLGVKYA
ncbi:MAG: ABC transporter ATP-binding protein [Nitrososphaerales archaeon]